jgi:hypothetical protein
VSTACSRSHARHCPQGRPSGQPTPSPRHGGHPSGCPRHGPSSGADSSSREPPRIADRLGHRHQRHRVQRDHGQLAPPAVLPRCAASWGQRLQPLLPLNRGRPLVVPTPGLPLGRAHQQLTARRFSLDLRQRRRSRQGISHPYFPFGLPYGLLVDCGTCTTLDDFRLLLPLDLDTTRTHSPDLDCGATRAGGQNDPGHRTARPQYRMLLHLRDNATSGARRGVLFSWSVPSDPAPAVRFLCQRPHPLRNRRR